MELAINEVKVQAKKLLKTIQTGHALPPQTPPAIATLTLQSIKLKHCLAIVAQQLGFENWRHAQNILSGSDMPFKTLDMGSLFYPKGCDYFINEWFADYADAKSTLLAQPENNWLFPYKKQFIVVKKDYIKILTSVTTLHAFGKKLIIIWSRATTLQYGTNSSVISLKTGQ